MGDDRKSPDEKLPDNPPSDKVTPIRRVSSKPPLDDALEELRRLLQETEPLDDELSDDQVIRDERKFRRRFGPGFDWRERDRIALIALKHEKDLTDAEIKLFRHTGNLSRGPFGVRLTATRWAAILGWVQLVYFGALLLALIAGLNAGMLKSPSRVLGVAALLFALVAFCVVIYWLYIKPWVVQRRTEERD